MKYLLLFLFSISFNTFASDEIKTKDMNNEELSALTGGEESAILTPEKAAELKAQIEKLKENQQKSDAALKELEEE
jgi:hypothetical protein